MFLIAALPKITIKYPGISQIHTLRNFASPINAVTVSSTRRCMVYCSLCWPGYLFCLRNLHHNLPSFCDSNIINQWVNWYYWVLRCKLAYIFANFVWKRRHLWPPPRLQYLPDVSVAHALSSSKVTAFAGLWKLLNLSDGIERFLLYILW